MSKIRSSPLNRTSKDKSHLPIVIHKKNINKNKPTIEKNNPSQKKNDLIRADTTARKAQTVKNSPLKNKRLATVSPKKTKNTSIKRIVAFGSTLIERDHYETYAEWLKKQKSKKLSKAEREKYEYLARPIEKHVHAECVPEYTFKPHMINPSKKRTREEMEDWCYEHSRPKPLPNKPEMKRRSRRTKPRTKAEREAWEYEQSRPKLPQPEVVRTKRSNLSKEEWVVRLERMCLPKRYYHKTPPPPYVNKNALKYTATPRIEKLAEPKPMHPNYVDPELTKEDLEKKIQNALEYHITPRMTKLAEPKVYPTIEETLNLEAFTVKPEALKYKASKRIIELAKPRVPYEKDDYDPYYVKPVGKNYVIKPRLEELSKPVERPNPPDNPFAFMVNPAALKYKASARIIELSRPKPNPIQVKHDCSQA
ncbi:hypothetical protein WDU94_006065 [Cyamophila willieti]